MASINTIVKRKQYLWLGIVVVGTASAIGGALYLSDVDMSGNGETVAEQEPVPLSQTSYGVPGLLLLAVSYRLYRADDLTERMVLSVCLVPAILAQNLITSEVAALAGLLVTGVTIWLVSLTGRTLPRFLPGDFFPVFYILHLTVLGILAL